MGKIVAIQVSDKGLISCVYKGTQNSTANKQANKKQIPKQNN